MSFKCIKAEQLYAKDPNLKKEDVSTIQKWLETQPHLPEIEESQILWSLHRSSYDPEAAKNRLDQFFTIRTICEEITTPITPDVLKTAVNIQFINVLPERTPEGYAVVVLKLLDPKPTNFSFVQFMTLLDMVAMLHLHQNGFEEGMVVLADPGAASFGHIFKLNFSVLKHCLYQMQQGTPVKIKGVHVIKSFRFVDKILFLLRPFLTKKLYNMIHFHSPNLETLFEKIPRQILPEEYGGQLPSIDVLNEQNLEKLLENYEFFNWLKTQKVDESKRTKN